MKIDMREPFSGKKKSDWFVRDCCGIFCAVITWMLVVYAVFVVTFVMILPALKDSTTYGIFNGVLFNTLAVMAISSHFKSMTTDPGTVPKGNATKENIESMCLQPGQILYKCAKCYSIKPERAHHCSVCKRCIRKMDHHCPWINNCVGENNQKYFVLFTFYIAAISLHALVLVIFQFLTCVDRNWQDCTSYSPPATIIFLVTLTFEGLLFFLFTCIMFCTQVHSMCYDETGIEQLKNEKHWSKKSKWLNIKSVFGDKFSYEWFIPFFEPKLGKRDMYQYVV